MRVLFASFYRWKTKNQVVKDKNTWYYGAPNFRCDISEYLALKAQLLLTSVTIRFQGTKSGMQRRINKKHLEHTIDDYLQNHVIYDLSLLYRNALAYTTISLESLK